MLIARYRGKTDCDECSGSRLRKDALYVKVGQKNIAEIIKMSEKFREELEKTETGSVALLFKGKLYFPYFIQ